MLLDCALENLVFHFGTNMTQKLKELFHSGIDTQMCAAYTLIVIPPGPMPSGKPKVLGVFLFERFYEI